MVELHQYSLSKMAIAWFFSQTRVASALCLLFVYDSSNHLASVPLLITLLVLALSAAALRFLPRIIKSTKADPIEKPSSDDEAFADNKASAEGLATFGCNAGIGDKDEQENLSLSTSNDEKEEDESWTDSISNDDDENLIEISLPDGHSLVRPPPEPRVRQDGLVELLQPEINEDDNLIEIDIIRGSIKCSRVGGIKG